MDRPDGADPHAGWGRRDGTALRVAADDPDHPTGKVGAHPTSPERSPASRRQPRRRPPTLAAGAKRVAVGDAAMRSGPPCDRPASLACIQYPANHASCANGRPDETRSDPKVWWPTQIEHWCTDPPTVIGTPVLDPRGGPDQMTDGRVLTPIRRSGTYRRPGSGTSAPNPRRPEVGPDRRWADCARKAISRPGIRYLGAQSASGTAPWAATGCPFCSAGGGRRAAMVCRQAGGSRSRGNAFGAEARDVRMALP
jgi:hypothetical protein